MKLSKQIVNKIIVFRALQLGDWLCAIPAIRALRTAYPKAEITLCGMPWSKFLLDRFPAYFDKFIHFPGFPGLPEQEFFPADFTGFLAEVQGQRFDLAIQMQGNGSVVNPMVELFGARYTAGFFLTGHYYPDNGLFTEYPNYGPEIERHLHLMSFLGIPLCGNELEFGVTETDNKELKELGLPIAQQKYICVHPGSRGAWRQWPVEHFAALADRCAESGFTPVITGTKEELEIASAVAGHMQQQPVMAIGRTSIGAAAALIKNSYALISNCTGVSHMAAAFKTPSVVISMDGEPERWAPLDRKVHKVIDWTQQPDFNLVAAKLDQLLARAS